MAGEYATLGQRIVEAARLAVAVHLFESRSMSENFGRRVEIGGAGPRVVGDRLDGQRVTDDARCGQPMTTPPEIADERAGA